MDTSDDISSTSENEYFKQSAFKHIQEDLDMVDDNKFCDSDDDDEVIDVICDKNRHTDLVLKRSKHLFFKNPKATSVTDFSDAFTSKVINSINIREPSVSCPRINTNIRKIETNDRGKTFLIDNILGRNKTDVTKIKHSPDNEEAAADEHNGKLFLYILSSSSYQTITITA